MKKFFLSGIVALWCTCMLMAQSSSFSFIHLSDLHVSTVSSAVNSCDINGVKARCYLHTFATMAQKPAFILCTGDISNIGNSTAVPGGMYTALTQYLYPNNLVRPTPGSMFIDSARTIPIYFAPGNHEYYTTLTSFSLTTSTLPLLDSIPNYVHYIGPDSDYAISNSISVVLFMRSGRDVSYLIAIDPKGSGYTTAQIDWMKTVLGQNAGKRKIIVMHHPPADTAGYSCGGASFSGNGNDSSSSFINNRHAFLDACDSFNVDLVLAGHVHQNSVCDRHGRKIDENCATCGTRYVQTGPAFAGCYRQITVDSAFVHVAQPMVSCDSTATTGIPDAIDDELELKVFPDPSNGLFTVSIGQSQPMALRVYNLLGECVHQQTGDGQSMTVDMRSQASGMYFVQVTTERLGVPVVYTLKYSLVISH